MKQKIQASLAGAMIFSALVAAAPAHAGTTEASASAETRCVVQKDGFTWNTCTNKERRKEPGAAGAAPAGAPPTEDREKARVQVFGLSFDVQPGTPEEDDLGYGVQHGGGGNGR